MKINKNKNKYLKMILIMMAIAGTIFSVYHQQRRMLQKELAEQILRLHVRANSNSEYDQCEKLMIRDWILDDIEIYRDEMTNIEKAKNCISKYVNDIEIRVNERIRKNGLNTVVHLSLKKEWFPQKIYGTLTFPEGKYLALVAEIGEGKGANWWCVLFPQLCFIASENGEIQDEDQLVLKDNLSDGAWHLIDRSNNRIAFKIYEWMKQCF